MHSDVTLLRCLLKMQMPGDVHSESPQVSLGLLSGLS